MFVGGCSRGQFPWEFPGKRGVFLCCKHANIGWTRPVPTRPTAPPTHCKLYAQKQPRGLEQHKWHAPGLELSARTQVRSGLRLSNELEPRPTRCGGCELRSLEKLMIRSAGITLICLGSREQPFSGPRSGAVRTT